MTPGERPLIGFLSEPCMSGMIFNRRPFLAAGAAATAACVVQPRLLRAAAGAIRWVTEQGCKPVFFNEGLLGAPDPA
jgi:hypothetical protein